MRFEISKFMLAFMVFLVAGVAQAADYYSNGYYDNYGYGNNSRQIVACESRDQRTVYCDFDTRYGVRLYRQLSSSACIEGRTWGQNGRGVWVSNGCRAQFVLTGGYGNGGYYGDNGYNDDRYGYGYGNRRTIRCESVNSRTVYCRTDPWSDVRLVRRLSQSACIEGSTWGRNRDQIWVTRGCRAEFRISRRSDGYYGNGYGNDYDYGYGYGNGYGNNYGYGNGYGNGYSQRVVCESRDGRYNFCRTGYIRQVQIYRRLSSSDCQYNYNWGYRSDGVWVNNGCRAEFLVY